MTDATIIVNPDRTEIAKVCAKAHLRMLAAGMKGKTPLARIKEILGVKGRTAKECWENLKAK